MSDQKSQKILKVIKWSNLITSISIIAFGITGVIFVGISSFLSFKFFLVFSPIFMTLFGVILLATQCKVDFILRRVGILRTLLGRGIFNIYLCSQVFYYFSCQSKNHVLGWAFAACLFILGIFYIILHFCAGRVYGEYIKQRIA